MQLVLCALPLTEPHGFAELGPLFGGEGRSTRTPTAAALALRTATAAVPRSVVKLIVRSANGIPNGGHSYIIS